MLLRSIEIQGFKSFADKTTLRFGKGITAVVGPNGSGKSNISDAVRWVLGEQSTKNLRGQSMEDVIFGGTADRRPHGYCEVTLVIDNSDRTLAFDNDSVAVTRRYYRSHESEYLINGVSVRLRDVNELFMDTGLGRDGYSMIGQGKIDSIISSKSQERRDIFEEASGISKYRYRKAEAERKLAAADDNMVRLKDILGELESRVGPLKEQSEKAEKFLKLAERKRELEIGLWMHTLNNFKDAVRTQDGKIALCESQYRETERTLADFEAEFEKSSESFSRITSEIDNIRAEISGFEERSTALAGEIALLENTISHNGETIERIDREYSSVTEGDDAARAAIEEKQNEIKEKEAMIAELEKKASETDTELNALLTDSENISKNIESLQRELNRLSSALSDERVRAVTSESASAEIKTRAAAVEQIIKERTEELSSLENELSENEKYSAEVERTIEAAENSQKGYELRREGRLKRAEAAKRKVEETSLDIETKKRRMQILADLEKNMEGFNHSVKQVTAEGARGLLRGICGPVSRIINVEAKYSVAIEVALGAALQNIIVETEADAKRAIDMLKRGNHGRATFLPVATVRARRFDTSAAENEFGFVGVGSALVECESKYREIINYLLGGTVVAEDIDCAVAIAKKTGYKLKTVSLDGQVVNPGGSLTGGSLSKQAGLLSRGGEIEKLKKEIEQLKKSLETAENEHTRAAEELASVDADIQNAKSAVVSANEDKIRVLGELKRLNDLKAAARQALDAAEKEKSLSEQKLKEHALSAEKSSGIIASLEAEIEKLNAETEKMTGGRDSLAAGREEIISRRNDYGMKILEIEKDAENIKLSLDSLNESLSSASLRKTELENEKTELLSKNEELSNQIEMTRGEIDALKIKKAESEKNIETLIARRLETEKSQRDMRERERELSTKRETLGGELARLSERRESMMRELDDVVKRLYDEYSLTRSEAEELNIVIENVTEAKKNLSDVKSSIRALGNVNVAAIEEYKEVGERYEFMSSQIADVEKSREELNKLISQLTARMKEMFSEGFSKISAAFSKTFSELFGGGTAELTLTDEENILESGIDIVAKLPGKNVPSLEGLSGGEKALVALSIYFSIMRVNAPPFCFLDEVDTALDDINVDRVADYMSRVDFKTQFICITHRRGTMEAADMLYGVTMQEKGVTKLLELDVAALAEKLNLNKE